MEFSVSLKVQEGTHRFFSVFHSLISTNQDIYQKCLIVELSRSSFGDICYTLLSFTAQFPGHYW